MTSDLRPFRDGNLWGFMDGGGDVAIAPQFDSAGSFSEGLARVKVNGKWGFVNAEGQMVIEPLFDQARFFQGGYGLSRSSSIPDRTRFQQSITSRSDSYT